MSRTLTCFLGIGLFGGMMFGQETGKDPFQSKKMQKEEMLDKIPETWEVMWEVFSVPFAEAAKLRRDQKDAVKMYAELVKRSEAGKAVLEEFSLLSGRIGKKSEGMSVEEMIYATEYEPPELPNVVKKVPENPEIAAMLMTPAMPSAFDTKNLGGSLEVAFVGEQTPEMIEVSVIFNRVELLDRLKWGQGKSTTEMPHFVVQGMEKTVFLKAGKPTLAGTMSPPKEGKERKDGRRVWFAFATATASEM